MTGSGICERELIESALAGDSGSRETLGGVVRARVYAYLQRVTLDPHKAEDLTQDTLVAVLKSMDGLRQVDRFWPWVFTIATNCVRQLQRSQAVRRAIQMSSLRDAANQLQSPEVEEGLSEMVQDEAREITRQALGCISERDRTFLILRFYKNLPHADIARAVGCSVLMSRASLHRAKHSFRREINRFTGQDRTLAGRSA